MTRRNIDLRAKMEVLESQINDINEGVLKINNDEYEVELKIDKKEEGKIFDDNTILQ